jgi:hypothetical protein
MAIVVAGTSLFLTHDFTALIPCFSKCFRRAQALR